MDFIIPEPLLALRSPIHTLIAGRAADLDGPLLLLASDAGAYLTGRVIAADGGHLVNAL